MGFALAEVRFDAQYGPKSDIVPSPNIAMSWRGKTVLAVLLVEA
ncbi:MAG TPA: hypothetical protein VI256_06775 [Roseiarcus sp.]